MRREIADGIDEQTELGERREYGKYTTAKEEGIDCADMVQRWLQSHRTVLGASEEDKDKREKREELSEDKVREE
jgi:hypothetical protein